MSRHLLTVMILITATAAVSEAQSREPYNHAAVWEAWDTVARDTYVRGVIDGAINAYIVAAEEWLGTNQLVKTPIPPRVARVQRHVFVGDVESRLPAVITDLYRDPANTYVVMVDMVYIARDKLEGKAVEPLLAEARKRALELHRLTNRHKG